MIDWQLIPERIDRTKAPFDGDDYLLYADSATVDVVRLCFWRDGKELEGLGDWTADDTGWWSYQHSVTQEQINFPKFTHWAPFEKPSQ
jgi:hypothetical protein